MARAVSRMLKQSRLREIKKDLEELEYDYRNQIEVDGSLLGPLTEAEYHLYKEDLEAMLADIEEELKR